MSRYSFSSSAEAGVCAHLPTHHQLKLAYAHIILLIISCILRMSIHSYSSAEAGVSAHHPIHNQLKMAHAHTILFIISWSLRMRILDNPHLRQLA
jgi:hypothetical protein